MVRPVLEQVLQAGLSGLARMTPLDRLGQLHLIADQYQVPGRWSDCDRIRQRDLAGLIDEQVVELSLQLLSAEDPGGPADQNRPVASTPATSLDSMSWMAPPVTSGC